MTMYNNCKVINQQFNNCIVIIKRLFSNTSKLNESRFNELNLQMISSCLHKQIFGNNCINNSYDKNQISLIKDELAKFGITTECISEIPDVDVEIPALLGNNIEEHFQQIAYKQVQPYLSIINSLLNEIPPLPDSFVFKEGWTRYSKSGCEAVDYPHENGLVYDVEVCLKNGPVPVLATAVSKTSWYSWVSKCLTDGTSNFVNKTLTPETLVPLESLNNDKGGNLNEFQQMPKIVVGHNVSFDRVRVKEQYWLNASATRFLDTMALHICVSGTSSYQRALLKSKSLDVECNELCNVSSLNNLADVLKLYCGNELDKEKRNIFVEGELHDIKMQFHELVSYCASDVIATHKVLQKLFPMFIERFPHPATLAGMLELGSAYLPVNYNWKRYIEETETTFHDLNLESKVCLSKRADQVCRLLISDKYKKNPWMWNEDWTIKHLDLKKGFDKVSITKKETEVNDIKRNLSTKFKYLNETKHFLPKKIPHMPGYPNWYRKLCEKQNSDLNLFPKSQKISTSMLITPKLLNLSWNNYPLHHIKEHGWGYLVPDKLEKCKTQLGNNEIWSEPELNSNIHSDQYSAENKDYSMQHSRNYRQNSVNKNHLSEFKLKINNILNTNENDCYFYKLPHKDGMSLNVGNPLAKDFLNKFSENVLTGIDFSASRILEISKMTSYWKNNRDRILSQLVIWLDGKQINTNKKKKNFNNFGAIIPQVLVSGTLTRRAVEATWMTAANAQSDRVGSELRGMINAPANYSIVGADVDSQELWIASIIGDSFFKTIRIQGATPFSWMTLIGTKSQGTDMHSVTATAIGISRDQAKVINYARIYGAGQKFAERLLKQFNPSMTSKEATLKSKKMLLLTKGERRYMLKKQYLLDTFDDKMYTANESFKIAQIYGKPRDEIFEKGKWVGGSESAMFNNLEEIAEEKEPKTPFLSSRLSRALETENNGKYLPTKINWVVQSSAVDFLHLTLVSMRWLMKDKARLCLTFHDEVRYLVPSKYKYNAALAMHITNLLVRSFFVSRLNMKDLPMSVAFFTAVEVDSVLRKEASHDCITPSNPHGLSEGYGIHHGESLNVWSAIQKSNGCVGMLPPSSKNISKLYI